MLFKYSLKLKPTSKPYMSTVDFAKLLAKEDELTPMSEAMLKALRHKRAIFFDLPLELEVIVDGTRYITLTKNINPPASVPTLDTWTTNNIELFKKDQKKFISNILKLYTKVFGFDVIEVPVTDDEVKNVIDKLMKLKEKQLKKIERLAKRSKQ